MKYVNFNQKEQKDFMNSIKNKSNLRWIDIASKLNINRSMVYFYANGSSKIPYNNYIKLCELIDLKPDFKSFVEIKNKVEPIKINKEINEDLSELLGILAGDGHISRKNYEISVSGHLKLDKEYILNNVSKLFKQIFSCNVKIKKYVPYNNIRSVVNSKLLWIYLVKEFKLPIGKKKGKLHIPSKIFENNQLLKKYIKGLFDTDGSIYLRRQRSMVLSIISRESVFLSEVKRSINKLGFNPSVSGKNLYLYNQNEIKSFFNNIKPSNKKHLNRFDKFIKKISIL